MYLNKNKGAHRSMVYSLKKKRSTNQKLQCKNLEGKKGLINIVELHFNHLIQSTSLGNFIMLKVLLTDSGLILMNLRILNCKIL